MAKGIYLAIIAGKVDTQDLLVRLQTLSYDLHVSRL